jgi:phosphatidylserine/phosphatidylglycerophosphate/cardiolipin synthase-like enzyme
MVGGPLFGPVIARLIGVLKQEIVTLAGQRRKWSRLLEINMPLRSVPSLMSRWLLVTTVTTGTFATLGFFGAAQARQPLGQSLPTGACVPALTTSDEQMKLRLDEALPPGEKSPSVESPKFKAILGRLAKTRYSEMNAGQLVADPVQSFALLQKMINRAQTSITFITSSFEADRIGAKVLKLLNAAHSRGVKVGGVVDPNTPFNALSIDGGKEVYMGDQGISEQHFSTTGMDPIGTKGRHEIFIRAADTAGAGMGVHIIGSGAKDVDRFVAQIWNLHVQRQGLSNTAKIEVQMVESDQIERPGSWATIPEYGSRLSGMAIITQKIEENIQLAILAAIRSAKTSIRIAKAHFIPTALMRDEIDAAIGRGVKVQIYTNSEQSVDDKGVAPSIMNSLRDLLSRAELRPEHNPEDPTLRVYLRNGTPLNQAGVLIDDRFLISGSYEPSPGSIVPEAAMVAATWGEVRRKLDDRGKPTGRVLETNIPGEFLAAYLRQIGDSRTARAVNSSAEIQPTNRGSF